MQIVFTDFTDTGLKNVVILILKLLQPKLIRSIDIQTSFVYIDNLLGTLYNRFLSRILIIYLFP